MLLKCAPKHLFTWNSTVIGPNVDAELTFYWINENGVIQLKDLEGDREIEIQKQGWLSGEWKAFSSHGSEILAQKSSSFSKTVQFFSHGESYQLEKINLFNRSMALTGPDCEIEIRPNHIFTKRCMITGMAKDMNLVLFATWMTLLLWRRSSRRNN